jgi:hypothetical protein
MGLALPRVEESTSWGSPSLKVGGRMFACMAIHSSAEPRSLVVMDIAARDELIDADPATYYITPHYVNYPVVLVRLAKVHDDALRDLLQSAWRSAMARAPRRRARYRGRAAT